MLRMSARAETAKAWNKQWLDGVVVGTQREISRGRWAMPSLLPIPFPCGTDCNRDIR
jgi:hypothetical protein